MHNFASTNTDADDGGHSESIGHSRRCSAQFFLHWICGGQAGPRQYYMSHISKLVRGYRSPRRWCMKILEIFLGGQKVLEMCPRAAQTSPIDRIWNVGTIYDGSMMRWTDRVAIGAENDRSTSGEPAEQMRSAEKPQNPSGAPAEPPYEKHPKSTLREIFYCFGSNFYLVYLRTH